MDSGGLSGSGIETISSVHQGAEMIAGGLRQQRCEHRCLSRRGQVAAANFGECMQRYSLDGLIDLRDPGGNAAPLLAGIDGKGGGQFLFNRRLQDLRSQDLGS